MIQRSLKVIYSHLEISKYIYFIFNAESFKTFQEYQHYQDTNFSLNAVVMTSKVIQGHIRPHLCQNHSSPFIYGPILKICMNANIMKTHYFHKLYNITYVIEKFCDSDLISILTYVLMENFFPCLFL